MVTLIERSIVLLLVAGLLIGVAAVLRPFTTAILFGTILAIAVWPLRQARTRWGLGMGWPLSACCCCRSWLWHCLCLWWRRP